MLQIRLEQPKDFPAIHSLYVRAFPTEAEAEVVDKLRARGAYLLSLVADFDGVVVGHIFFTPATIEKEDGTSLNVAGLAPMAVQPELQRHGIGSLLVRAGLEALQQRGLPAVVVLGYDTYYPRFGFVPASRWGLHYATTVPDEVFMALELQPGALIGNSGVVLFQEEFREL